MCPSLERAVEIDPGLLGAWEALFVSRSEPAGIQDAAEHAFALGTSSITCLGECLDGLIVKGETARALEVGRRLTALRSDRADTWRHLATAELALGRVEDAIADAVYAYSLADTGERVNALVVQAQAFAAKGDGAHALDAARGALRLSPDPTVAGPARAAVHAVLGLALELQGDPGGADEACGEALAIAASQPLALKVRGRVRLKRGDASGAEDLHRFLALRPHDRDAESLLGLLAPAGERPRAR